ncbi:large conductance mechanosensitive channel protein MscL [Microcoleus sp. AT3-A2]|uniref:large conductance mechanosensitive channel protein MscL n=1 Tax=Microcoleaceae TaxID=1892252 RepID=UPI0018825280|nr:large conductance mechanosensitive channel protein MscL [Tychonema sp. LEGE 06208]MBE9163381.1 large conductance mechanosensitive channel protein MscL [Tychonema sp. LEGE 06208]
MARSSSGFWSDFWKFLVQGNVLELAVAVIIGGAFGKIIDSLVKDIITPILLNPALTAAGAKDLESWAPGGIKWGVFLASVISFVIIAFVIFLLLRSVESAKKRLIRRQAAEAEAEVALVDAATLNQEKMTEVLERLAKALESRGI